MFTIAVHHWNGTVDFYEAATVGEDPRNNNDTEHVHWSPNLYLTLSSGEVLTLTGFMTAYVMNATGKTVHTSHGSKGPRVAADEPSAAV